MFNLVPVILVLNDEYWLPYALESIRGVFDRYVIYNVGSKDATGNIIDWFVETEKHKAAFLVNHFTKIPNITIQGIFRNSMIAETQADWYFILDGDEVYNLQNWSYIRDLCIAEQRVDENKVYGVFERREIGKNLRSCYDETRTHHRIYHRRCIWKGTHPGEEPVLQQRAHREFGLPVLCNHFHNTVRSRLESEVPKRTKRKTKGTYTPGNCVPFNLIKEIPILRTPINNFPVSPELEKLQHEYTHTL